MGPGLLDLMEEGLGAWTSGSGGEGTGELVFNNELQLCKTQMFWTWMVVMFAQGGEYT